MVWKLGLTFLSEALVKAFTPHTRLLRDLPHTLRFGHIADCGLPQRRIVKLGHR